MQGAQQPSLSLLAQVACTKHHSAPLQYYRGVGAYREHAALIGLAQVQSASRLLVSPH